MEDESKAFFESIEEVEKEKDELKPVEEWNGECWKAFFDQFCVQNAEDYGIDPWEILANFIWKVYVDRDEEGNIRGD